MRSTSLRVGLLVLSLAALPLATHASTCSDVLLQTAPTQAATQPKVPQDITESLEALFVTLEQQYAPLALKEILFGFNWEEAKDIYRARMSQARTSREAMLIYADVLNSFNDAHVGAQLPSSLTYSMPIQLFHVPSARGERGEIVLSHVNEKFMSFMESSTSPFSGKSVIPLSKLPAVGDTVVAIEGMHPDEFFTEFLGAAYTANGNEITNYSLAAMGLSRMRESRGVDLRKLRDYLGPSMLMRLTLKRLGSEDRLYDFLVPVIPSGFGTISYAFDKDGKFIKYPEGLAPYDPNKVYVPSFEEPTPTEEKSFLEVLFGLRDRAPEIFSSPQDIAVRWNPKFRSFEKLMTETLPESSAVTKVMALSEKVHELFNLGSQALDYSYDVGAMGEEDLAANRKKKPEHPPINIGQLEPLVELPRDFKRIQPPRVVRSLLNSDSFFAGTFEHNGKRVGYLRVPSYGASNIVTLQFGVRYYLGQLEKNSDYLIFDQINNPGGYVLFSDMLVKGFTGSYDHDRHMKFAVRPTTNFLQQMPSVIQAVKEIASTLPQSSGLFKGQLLDEAEVHELLSGLDADLQRVYRVLDKDYQKDSSRPRSVFEEDLGLTEPISLSRLSEFMELVMDRTLWNLMGDPKTAAAFANIYKWVVDFLGVDIFDSRVQYTKPVYMWINDLDFSGGDATPALLQDYGRVKLVGVRTAGAGGTVNSFSFHHAGETDFSTSLTTSLMVRNRPSSDLPWWVENEGVHPDIPFALTDKDIASGFSETLQRLLKAIGE